ncbi:TPA: flagellar export protein FliJ [Yersinia enterocolitica]
MSDKLMNTLQQLQQLRQRALDQATSQLAQQKQLCQRYQNNINALSSLTHFALMPVVGAALMTNSASYKRNIQRVIDWQKQEQVLANIEAGKLQTHLQQQACREKIVAVVLEQQQQHQVAQGRREQKITDGLAAQCWQRRRAG